MPCISLRDISLGYGRRTLVEGGCADFEAGELIALVGRNGSGKSTLLRAIAGLGPLRSGSILVGGRDRAKMTAGEAARSLSLVTTERVRICDLSVREVVALGRAPYTDWIGRLGDADRRAVAQALELVGMDAMAAKSFDTLSDGECQRVMIARALAQDTPVVLLDEPTAFLDVPNRYEICALLASLARGQGKTILFSTHEMEIAMHCERIVLLDPPRLHCDTPERLAAGGHIERLIGAGAEYAAWYKGTGRS